MGDPWRKYPLLTSGQAYKMDHFLMRNPWALPVAGVLLAIILIVGAYFIGRGLSGPDYESFSMDEGPPRLSEPSTKIKEVIKTVEVKVPSQGVPGELIAYTGSEGYLVGGWGDNIHWDGVAVNPVDGIATIKVDPANNIGSVLVDLKDVSINSEDRTFLKGDVRIEFNAFFGKEGYKAGGIVQDLELFGNTGIESIQFPRTSAKLAGWGSAEVLLDGQSVYSKLPAFFMVNDAIRRDDNTIALIDGTLYSPKASSTGGFSDPSRQEMTLMFHSNEVDKKNKPQNSVFIHLVFKEVDEGPVELSNQDVESGAEAVKEVDYSESEIEEDDPVDGNSSISNGSSSE